MSKKPLVSVKGTSKLPPRKERESEGGRGRKRGKKEGYRERERESLLPDFTISVNGYFQQYHVSLASPSIPIGLYHYWVMILLLVTKRVPIKQ